MTYAIAIWGAFVQQWKVLSPGWNWVVGMVANVPMVLAFAWVATQSNRSSVVGYVAIGLFFMTLWNQSQIGIRWSVGEEAWMGTLEFSLISRTPLAVFLFGKSLAYAASAARPALVALIAALLIARQPPNVAYPAGLAFAVGIVFLAVVATGFIFAPLNVLAARQLDPVVALRAFVVVFSGFLYPVVSLPAGLEAFARLFPTAWAMAAVLLALEGGPTDALVLRLAEAVGLSALYLALTWVMFQRVEQRVRVSGALIS